jgi:hypothetical protein
LITLFLATSPAGAEPDADEASEAAKPVAKTVCELIETAAGAHDIPVDFLTRLIWQESRFRADALSPKGAEGIAQFMPGTAALRRLQDPYDAEEAIPASAEYLSELARRFGNLGLAAAAYNAGEQRVGDWLAGIGGLPLETRDYVLTITGRAAEEWTGFDPNRFPGGILPGPKVTFGCVRLAAMLAKSDAGARLVESVPRAPAAPWGAQVAGNFSLKRALASYAALQRRQPRILGEIAPMVLGTVDRSRGRARLYRVCAPAQSRAEAERLCRTLQSAGAACVVVRNN